MKYLTLLLLFVTSFANAQSFKEKTEAHRTAYKTNFLKDSRSPLREADFKDLHFFEPDSTYEVIAKVELLQNQKKINMPTYDGTSKEFIRYAKVEFTLNGKTLNLTLYRNLALATNPVYKDYLFIPFTDETNQSTTYGGGRYLDIDLKTIVNNKVTIDFNKAYNPYCAYSDGYRCPVPPEENDLLTSINAGEKRYTGEKKHP